jgi:putative acetyltransferase
MIVVRQEQPADFAAIRSVTEQAFGRSAEADLIEALRTRGQVLLSLVAERGTELVGHCLFSPVTLAAGGNICAVVGLGPMAVIPALQRQGIGTLLVQYGLEHCRQADYDGVVVLGHAAYYPRFGFAPASRYAIRCEYDVPDEVFMAIEFRLGALQECAGTAKYQPEFNQFT